MTFAKLVRVKTNTQTQIETRGSMPVCPAATIALLRDRPAGPEVFLLRRSAKQAFGACAYVYPGGRVESADSAPALQRRYAPDAAEQATAILGRADALAYWHAAVRECFEEAGVLVGCSIGKPQQPVVLHGLRDELNAGALTWPDLVQRLDLHFAVDGLRYFAFWTTPPGMTRRFSTRFFMARMPANQQAVPDGSETTRGEWLRPADALQRHEQGDIELMRPTVATLQQMCEYADTATALADVVSRPVCTRP